MKLYTFAVMELKETRGRRPKYLFPDLERGETYEFVATHKSDINKDGTATHAYASKIAARVMYYSKKNNLGWKIARRTFGAAVQITILP